MKQMGMVSRGDEGPVKFNSNLGILKVSGALVFQDLYNTVVSESP